MLGIRKAVLLVLTTCGFFSSQSFAGVIRHDVPDSDYLALANSSAAYGNVGRLYSSAFSGSGTLIAPNIVLTAGHIVDNTGSLNFSVAGQSFAATNWIAFSKWNPDDILNGYDIGLVQFDVDISAATGVTVAERYRGQDILGRIGTSVGYGITGTGLTGFDTFTLEKRAGQNVIDAFVGIGRRRTIVSDFDNPLDPSDSAFGSSTPLALEYAIAPGDSGGGLFINVDGVDLLAGVHSFIAAFDGQADSDYGDLSGSSFVTPFNSWIDRMIRTGLNGGRPIFVGGASGGALLLNSIESEFETLSNPEPTSLTLLGIGAISLSGFGWRRKRRIQH